MDDDKDVITININNMALLFSFLHLKTFSRKQTSAASTALGFLFVVFPRLQTTKAWLPDQIPDPIGSSRKKGRKEREREMRESVCVCVCVCERERERECVCM